MKRQLRSSGQGAEQFKNEVALVEKLQHRNLVRLLGFCLDGGETILVFEFVSNKSLDYFLFGLSILKCYCSHAYFDCNSCNWFEFLYHLNCFFISICEYIYICIFQTNVSFLSKYTDDEKRGILDWSLRQKIIGGIAKGLLYLHEDSRLRIIHRDLKASNVLLDGDMNPKISDFGTAKMFGIDQIEGNTRTIVGT